MTGRYLICRLNQPDGEVKSDKKEGPSNKLDLVLLGPYERWLSYRERAVLGQALSPEEVWYHAEATWRIGAILAITDTPAVSNE